jgi:hypothetical protein
MPQNTNTAKTNRNSAITNYSAAAESVLSDPVDHVVLSRETPIIIQNPNPSRGQERTLKTWAKHLLPFLIVLGLAFVMAIVLVVLAVMGYLGKGEVEEIQIIQSTGTATTNVAGPPGEPVATHWLVKTSGETRVKRDMAMILAEMVLGWIMVRLFGA